ncbi:MAG: hypothetical protein IID41_07265 [Planctomycetes bacterium]|nr:hypothetical protein [Planctomycetota bacterium]
MPHSGPRLNELGRGPFLCAEQWYAVRMGADVEGIRPSSKAGENFRANIHQWHAMRELILDRASDIISVEEVDSWQYMGAEFDDPESCVLLASKLRQWADEHHSEHVAKDSSPFAHAVEKVLSGVGTVTPGSPTSVSRDHVLGFCDFLINCGGFVVY